MKFFLDENFPVSSIDVFKELGYEVEHARTSGLYGAPDKKIVKYAKKKKIDSCHKRLGVR